MHCRKVYLGLMVAIVALFPALTQAVPTLNVTPGSIATDATDPVQLQVGALAGAQAILREGPHFSDSLLRWLRPGQDRRRSHEKATEICT